MSRKINLKMTVAMTFTSTIVTLIIATQGCSRNEAPHEAAPTAAAQEPNDAPHESHEHAMPTEAPTLPAGQLWTTDEPLRTAMQRIRTAVEKTVPAYERHQLPAADAQSLATTVNENITYMIANCKLEPKPDAALHALIGRMLNAAASVQKEPASTAGVPQLLAVLHDYQSTFDHPGWQPLTAH